MISNSTIQKIFDYAKIEEVIGDFVKLKKSGVNYKGNCPFHNEKTPSFMVNPAKNIFKCFGCGEAGNAVAFIMKHEHYTYPEALRYLAQKYFITIEEDTQSLKSVEDVQEKESLFNLNAFAQKYFTEMLFNSEAGKAIALTYLSERGFNKADYEKFLIGFNPDIWDAFTKHASENGYSMSLLEKSGLTIFKDTNKCYDRFKGRIIFPIQNLTGRIVGFGGRLIGKDENRPKYVNSPETDIYNKSKILYGLFQAKSKIIFYDNCYLVEGYTDVISMHRSGIENVVASSGTSLTKDQILLIKRYTQNITVLFDGDVAGIKASLRGIDMILEEGLNVRVVNFPDGDDPDSFSKKHTAEKFRQFVSDNAQDFIRFKTGLLLKETHNDPIKKAQLIKDILETISLIPDAVNRSVYIKECSVLLDMDELILQNQLNSILRSKFKKTQQYVPDIPEDIPKQPVQHATEAVGLTDDDERGLLRFLLNYGNENLAFIKPEALERNKTPYRDDDTYTISIAAYYVQQITMDNLAFENKIHQQLFDEIALNIADGQAFNEQTLLNNENEGVKSLCIDLLVVPYELSPNWAEMYDIHVPHEKNQLSYYAIWFLNNFKSRKLYVLLKENAEKIKHAQSNEELEDLLKTQMQLSYVKKELAKTMNRVFLK